MVYIIQVLLVAVLAAQLHCRKYSMEEIPFENVKIEIFDSRPTNFEKNISNSLETIKNFWADETVETVIGTGSAIVHFLPFGEAITTIAEAVIDLLKDESDWKDGFVRELKKQQDVAIVMNQIDLIAAEFKTIKSKLPSLNASREPNLETRKTHSNIIHSDLDTILNYYDKSIFRKYPLLTAPLLINLGHLITVFAPISNDIYPLTTELLPIACKAYDLMKLYRTLAVYHRLQKTSLKYLRYKEVMDAMAAIDTQGIRKYKLACSKGCQTYEGYCESKRGLNIDFFLF